MKAMQFVKELGKIAGAVLLFCVLQQGISGMMNQAESYSHIFKSISDGTDAYGFLSAVAVVLAIMGTFFIIFKFSEANMTDAQKKEIKRRSNRETPDSEM